MVETLASAIGPESRWRTEQPESGRYVKVGNRFMVPYEQRIPGSQAVIKMVPVPAGVVVLRPLPMLSESDRSDDDAAALSLEKSQHRVSTQAFWISQYEITMQQFLPYRSLYYEQKEAVKNNRGRVPKLGSVDAVTGPTDVYEPDYNFEYAEAPDSPVPTSTQFSARQYTKWLSLLTGTTYRIPMRSEWQHACLADSASGFCFGNDARKLRDYAVFVDSLDRTGEEVLLRVGTKRANEWGIFDMHGNVAEWVIEDSAPRGMYYGHVACGGSFQDEAKDCSASSVIRSTVEWWDDDPEYPPSPWWATSDQSRGTGFRIVSPITNPSEKQKKVYWEPDSEMLKQQVEYRLKEGRGSIGRVNKSE